MDSLKNRTANAVNGCREKNFTFFPQNRGILRGQDNFLEQHPLDSSG
jgi:hypothetical protein